MKQLKEDYEKKLKTALEVLRHCPLDIEKETILTTKIKCYRVFIAELDKEINK